MMTGVEEEKAPRGAQTLVRGLKALTAVALASDGMSIVDLAELLDVHRSIAYRILTALAESGFVARGSDGRYRGASGLIRLARGAHGALRATALPILQDLAERLGTTVTLFVREGGFATAVAVVESPGQGFRMAFGPGWKHPLDRGAAGHAIRSLEPETDSDDENVRMVREQGYALTFSEVEPNLYGLAVPIPHGPSEGGACINLVSNRRDVVENSLPAVVEAAARIAAELQTDFTV